MHTDARASSTIELRHNMYNSKNTDTVGKLTKCILPELMVSVEPA